MQLLIAYYPDYKVTCDAEFFQSIVKLNDITSKQYLEPLKKRRVTLYLITTVPVGRKIFQLSTSTYPSYLIILHTSWYYENVAVTSLM